MATLEELLAVQQELDAPAQTGGASLDELLAIQQELDAPQELGFFGKVADVFTGESQTTPELDALQEIGDAQELNEFSMAALKTSFGLLATGDTKRLKKVITDNIPSATFREDAKGNTIAVLPSGEFALNKPGLSPQDVIKGVFDLAAFSPVGRVASVAKGGLAKVAAVGAASAGTEAVIQQAALGDVSGKDVVLAGALGAGGQGLAEVGSAAVRGIKGAIAPDARQVIQAGERAGVPVLTTDVLPPEGIVGRLARGTGDKIPFAGTSGVRASQQKTREAAAVELSNSLPRATATDIVESLKAQKDKVKQAAGNRINNVTNAMNEVGPVPMANVSKAAGDAFDALDKVKIGKDQATIDKITEIQEGIGEVHSFGDLRDARTAVRELAESTDPLIRSQLPSRSKAALKRIESGITRDLDSFVKVQSGQRGLDRYKQADLVYAQEAKKFSKSRLKSVLDKGDITPEAVNNLLFSKKPSEVKVLHDSLTAEGKKAARSSLISKMIADATTDSGISVNKLATSLHKMKGSTDIFFKGKDRQQLEGLSKLLSATRHAQDAKVVTPTGQNLLPLAMGSAAGSSAVTVGILPTLGAATTAGVAARIYESAPMRNFLLRLANTPRNSKRFDALINSSAPKINALMQSIRDEE